MATITVRFDFVRGDDTETDTVDFETNSSLVYDLDTHAEDWIEKHNSSDNTDEWELDRWAVEDWECAYSDPDNFSDLDEYSEFVDKVDEHGQGYRLRYEDIGEFDFDDSYQGCWASEEEFIQDLFESSYSVPDELQGYIDWESMTRDFMMDYSSYDTSDGYHIFRD